MSKRYGYILFIFIMFFTFIACNCFQRESLGLAGEDCGSGWKYPKKYAIRSEYSRQNTPCEHVYCDDEFDFKEKGVLKGSFILPRQTYFYGLAFQIYLSEFYRLVERPPKELRAFVRIPVTLVFEWDGKDGSRKRVEAKPDLDRDGAIRNYTWEGYINFAYVPLPYEKKIDYTLIYDKGEFLKDRNYPLVYKLVKEGERVKAVDMTELLEKDRTLWKAHFVVGEGNVKGSPDRSKKPARD